MSAALLLLGAAGLAGCSSAIDHIPQSMGGLPEGVPARPAVPLPFPAVHDMPPDRAQAPLTEEERKRLREDLIAARERAERAIATSEPAATAPPQPAGAAPKP